MGNVTIPANFNVPAVAEVVEDADLFDHAQGRVERKKIDQRAQTNAFRLARDRAEVHARDRHHVDGRRVVLGDVVAVEARVVGGRDEREALVELLRERTVGTIDVVEEAEFHASGTAAGCGLVPPGVRSGKPPGPPAKGK